MLQEQYLGNWEDKDYTKPHMFANALINKARTCIFEILEKISNSTTKLKNIKNTTNAILKEIEAIEVKKENLTQLYISLSTLYECVTEENLECFKELQKFDENEKAKLEKNVKYDKEMLQLLENNNHVNRDQMITKIKALINNCEMKLREFDNANRHEIPRLIDRLKNINKTLSECKNNILKYGNINYIDENDIASLFKSTGIIGETKIDIRNMIQVSNIDDIINGNKQEIERLNELKYWY